LLSLASIKTLFKVKISNEYHSLFRATQAIGTNRQARPTAAAKITTVLTMPEITEGNFMVLWDIFMLSLFDTRKLDSPIFESTIIGAI